MNNSEELFNQIAKNIDEIISQRENPFERYQYLKKKNAENKYFISLASFEIENKTEKEKYFLLIEIRETENNFVDVTKFKKLIILGNSIADGNMEKLDSEKISFTKVNQEYIKSLINWLDKHSI